MLVPISKTNNRSNGMFITADKYERLCLSKELQKEFNEENKELYLYWDEKSRTIGISKKGHDNSHVPYKFDSRWCASANDYLRRCGVETRESAVKFLYDGNEGEILLFRQAGIRIMQTFKQEANGNLVTCERA
ncbi:hypothetical protein [Paenibacillus sp. UMB4589-SE434]|uniref:hypothetical protein n=1 Tax=Paenibacillus sp. UMB4589-SE434 TaxID=3046314 RepID=UPI002551A76B|nr:hypothetical protein [Paenibacillus sp. UMB4589-SE434]MDK8182085.1 hypothetical protein [Paenibacillus sp. UMB4589-SE434]